MKQNPGDDQPRPSGPTKADVNRHLCGVRAWDQIRRADQIEKFFIAEPLAPPYRFVVHQGDVGRGAAEGGHAEPEKQRRHFGHSLRQRSVPLMVAGRIGLECGGSRSTPVFGPGKMKRH
ncbi:MAG: hypothetical protein MPW15_23990 [Candidatus Manganitrophus sp.]|nr:hypothetical protein [Candidatus Manganitrophus sp.]